MKKVFSLFVLIILFNVISSVQADITSQQAETNNIDTIISNNIVDGVPNIEIIKAEICDKIFNGACSLATRENIIGIWEKTGGTKPPIPHATFHIFAFSEDGKTTEKDLSKSYHETEEILPGFINSGIWQDYNFQKNFLTILTNNGEQVTAIVFYFIKDVPEDVALKALNNIGTPQKGGLLLIFPEETILIKKVGNIHL